MSARQFDNPAVIGPRVESHKNLFFETEVDFNTPFQHQSTPPDTRFVSGNGTSNIKSKARFLVSGSAAQLFDATHPSITVKQMPQCRIPYAQTSITCDASNRSECNKLQTPGIIVLIPCHGDRSRNIRVMRVSKPQNSKNGIVALDSDFKQLKRSPSSQTLAFTMDYSNHDSFFKMPGLAATRDRANLIPLATRAVNGFIGDTGINFRKWVNKMRSSNAEDDSVQGGCFKGKIALLDKSIAQGTCSSGEANLKLSVDTDLCIGLIFGVKVIGTIVPPNIKEAYVYVKTGGHVEISADLEANLMVQAIQRMRLPHIEIPGFGVEGIINVGPELEIDLLGVADLQALGNVNANITMPLPEKDFYLGIAGGKVENDDNQPTRDQPFMRSNITNSLLLNGQIGFHILPAVKFRIDDLVGQHQASVGMQFDSGITIRGQPVSSQAVSACSNGTAEISGKVISELSGKVVAREAIDLISTPLFNTCSQNDLSSPDHSKLVADVNPNLEKIECLSSDFPVPANIPFDQRRSFSQGPQYEVLDLCWYKNDTQGPCPKEQKPLKNPHQFKNVGYTIGNLVWSYVKYQAIGFHGTSRKRFDSIKAEGVRCREAVITADAIENEQFGPGFYTTINREVATIYANKAAENDGSQPIISIVWIPSIQTMKGKVYPWQGLRNDLGAPDPDTPWFGKTKTGGAKYPEADPTFATQLLTDFDYIAGPLKTAVSTVQIKVNPKNCNQITLTESTTDSKWLTPRFFQPDWLKPN